MEKNKTDVIKITCRRKTFEEQLATQKRVVIILGIAVLLICVIFSGCIDDIGDDKLSYNEVKDKLGLRSTTYDEMAEFIERDKTNDREYVSYDYESPDQETFTCDDFSDMLIKNARKNGFDVGYVVIYQTRNEYFDINSLSLSSHALVCFNTTEGIYFVEPQNDKVMSKRKFMRYQKEDCYPYASGFIVGLSSMNFHHYRTDWFHDITYSWNYNTNEWHIKL